MGTSLCQLILLAIQPLCGMISGKEGAAVYLHSPVKIYSEDNCVISHSGELSALGNKAMILTGKSSAKKCGALQDVLSALGETPYVLYDAVEENPSIETVMRARDIAVKEGADFFIGIGGGSPMDAAKAVALMAKNPELDSAVLYEPIELEHYPIACIPTTCGTGAEVTHNAVLTRHALRTKKSIAHKMYPSLALLDSKYLRAMPRAVLVNTCVDALSHLLESRLNFNSNELNRCYSRQGLILWGRFRDRLMTNCLTDNDYRDMLHASLMGGLSISHTGTSLPHGLSYALTYELGMPHGQAVGAFLGGFAEKYPDAKASEEAAQLLGFESSKALHAYLLQLLGHVEVESALLEAAAAKLLEDPRKLKNFPFPLDKKFICSLLN